MGVVKIRKAVGAIVYQRDEFLLVHKVKSIEEDKEIIGQWDFPKGGVNELDFDFKAAILRELKEETGSDSYRVTGIINKKISFDFPKPHKYDRQETVMFYVEYLGDRTDLKPQDDEIDKVKFFSKEDLTSILSLKETIEFFKEVVLPYNDTVL